MSTGHTELPIPTICGQEKCEKKLEKEIPVDDASLKWQHALPEKVKHIMWTIKTNSTKVYESTTPKTMKYLALISSMILFFAVLSLVLAQRDEAAQSKYGMAFPIDESAKAEKQIAAASIGGVPGEAAAAASSESKVAASDSEVTTTAQPPSSTELPKSEESKYEASPSGNQESPISVPTLLATEEDEKPDEEERNSRIVFIERLMGLHLSAPARPNGEQEGEPTEEKPALTPEEQAKKDKVNAKWASRTRTFSIPLPNGAEQPVSPFSAGNEQSANPLLRYAAAAMISKLITAAARSQMEQQAREALISNHLRVSAKDKDEDSGDDETVPVIVATMRDDHRQAAAMNHLRNALPPMYGRPLPRQSPVMRVQPAHPFIPQLSRPMPSMPHRQFLPPPPPQATQAQPQRRSSNVQPVIVMMAVPLQNGESRQAQTAAITQALPNILGPLLAQQSRQMSHHQMPVYPMHMQRPMASYQMPVVQVPAPIHYPWYQQARQMVQYQPTIQRPMASYSHMRPVIEVPVEVPVPYHVPMTMPIRSTAQQPPVHSGNVDQVGSEQDHIVLLYDAEIHHGGADEQSDNGQQEPMKQAEPIRRLPMPLSANKAKLFRELMNAKHATQSGVRFIPISAAGNGDDSPAAKEQNTSESTAQPAFILFSEHDERQ